MSSDREFDKDIVVDQAIVDILDELHVLASNGELIGLMLVSVREDGEVLDWHAYKPGGRLLLLSGTTITQNNLIQFITARPTSKEDTE